MRLYHDRLPDADVILECGNALLWFITGLKDKTCALLPRDKEDLMNVVRTSLMRASELGIHLIPKHHLCMHWGLGCHCTGNPEQTAAWGDEYLNGFLAKIAASAHVLNFTARVLLESKALISAKKPFKKRQRHH